MLALNTTATLGRPRQRQRQEALQCYASREVCGQSYTSITDIQFGFVTYVFFIRYHSLRRVSLGGTLSGRGVIE